MKVMGFKEFDRKYSNIKDYPSEFLYKFYVDLMEEITKELEKMKGDIKDNKYPF